MSWRMSAPFEDAFEVFWEFFVNSADISHAETSVLLNAVMSPDRNVTCPVLNKNKEVRSPNPSGLSEKKPSRKYSQKVPVYKLLVQTSFIQSATIHALSILNNISTSVFKGGFSLQR